LREDPTAPTALAEASGPVTPGGRTESSAYVAPLTASTPTDTATLQLPKPETVLRSSEIEQTRRTAIAGIVFNTLGLVVVPFLGGDETARMLCLASLACAELNNAWLLYMASNEQRYEQRYLMIYFGIAPLLNAGIMYYLGVFGPVLVMFALNLYTACLAYDRRVALVTLVGSAVPMVALGSLMIAGVIGDPGMITVAAHIGGLGRVACIFAFVTFLYLVYMQGRTARIAMVASLTERDEAVRRASHREALFLEARRDLERALHAGGLGRFSEQTLGSYRLGAVIGRGGMGEVYDAIHVDNGQPAAVKMLLPEVLSRPDYVRRFRREVRIAASLDSPNVVRVLEVGDESAPLPYLAMERLRGEDLAQILRREAKLEPPAIIDMIRQIGRGLRAASDAGIVHRDLKPQNVFLAEGDSQTWKILDFGVSKLVQGEAALTIGETIGTPQYMAPEQARGATVDARTDLYALGTIVYRALTGHPPFSGDNIVMAVLTSMPMRPSSLLRLHRDVDLALAIALAKQPADRFSSADELADAFEAALAGHLADTYRKRATALLAKLPWTAPSR
jgi:serine/threonine-protein kinase